MKKINLVSVLIMLFLLISCTSNSPEALGKEIYKKYEAFLKEVSATINEGEKSCAKINEIAEKYKRELIELGKKREQLAPEDKIKCDQSTVDTQRELYLTNTAEFITFNTYLNTMDKSDYACYKQVSDCFILAQYGNFDLLRTQAPDEAIRFGVK